MLQMGRCLVCHSGFTRRDIHRHSSPSKEVVIQHHQSQLESRLFPQYFCKGHPAKMSPWHPKCCINNPHQHPSLHLALQIFLSCGHVSFCGGLQSSLPNHSNFSQRYYSPCISNATLHSQIVHSFLSHSVILLK